MMTLSVKGQPAPEHFLSRCGRYLYSCVSMCDVGNTTQSTHCEEVTAEVMMSLCCVVLCCVVELFTEVSMLKQS